MYYNNTAWQNNVKVVFPNALFGFLYTEHVQPRKYRIYGEKVELSQYLSIYISSQSLWGRIVEKSRRLDYIESRGYFIVSLPLSLSLSLSLLLSLPFYLSLTCLEIIKITPKNVQFLKLLLAVPYIMSNFLGHIMWNRLYY